MTKQDLQKELLEKVKPGVKASDLKKLKRSKSDSDIPKAPPLPLSESDFAKSGNTSFSTSTQALATLTAELQKQTDLNTLLTEQLKAKQQQIENLRKQLETNPNPT